MMTNGDPLHPSLSLSSSLLSRRGGRGGVGRRCRVRAPLTDPAHAHASGPVRLVMCESG